MPFDWASSFYNPESEFRWGEVLSLCREFNIHKGIVVPVPSRGGIVGLVWSAGPHFDERAKYTPYLHVLALNMFHRLRQLGAAAKRTINLTAREREVMSSVARCSVPWFDGMKETTIVDKGR